MAAQESLTPRQEVEPLQLGPVPNHAVREAETRNRIVQTDRGNGVRRAEGKHADKGALAFAACSTAAVFKGGFQPRNIITPSTIKPTPTTSDRYFALT